MHYISDILYWISTGLLVPVILLLIYFFCRSLLMVAGFFGQYLDTLRTHLRTQVRPYGYPYSDGASLGGAFHRRHRINGL